MKVSPRGLDMQASPIPYLIIIIVIAQYGLSAQITTVFMFDTGRQMFNGSKARGANPLASRGVVSLVFHLYLLSFSRTAPYPSKTLSGNMTRNWPKQPLGWNILDHTLCCNLNVNPRFLRARGELSPTFDSFPFRETINVCCRAPKGDNSQPKR